MLKAAYAVMTAWAVAVCGAAAEKPVCAVLTFKAGEGVGLGEAGILANRVSALLEQSGRYRVMPRFEVHQRLGADASPSTDADYAVTAGRTLNVPFVVAGDVAAQGGTLSLNTALVDVSRGKPVSTAVYLHGGDRETFMRQAPAASLRQLLAIEAADTPAVPEPDPEPDPEPAVTAAAPAPARAPMPAPASVPEPQAARPAASVPEPPAPAAAELPEEPEPPRAPGPAVPRGAPERPKLATPAEPAWEQPEPGWLETVAWPDMSGWETVYRKGIRDRLEIGLRSTDFELKTTVKDGPAEEDRFLGTINRLEEDTDQGLNKLMLRYYVIPWLGVELTWDEIRARTITMDDGHSDGTFVAEGMILSAMGRVSLGDLLRAGDWAVNDFVFPEKTRYAWGDRVRFYAGIGRADFSVDFDEEPWWNLGYAGEADWIDAGRPTERTGGRRRTIDTTDETGDVTLYGMSVYVTRYLTVEFFMRDMDLETRATYTRSDAADAPTTRTIPLDSEATGVGVTFVF
ncbi:MAG: hypothetical protein JW951_03435 [Lentisphaerae bacterium]|nr:hypothetical protein [Lentisphaerota bacterium]